MSKKMNYEPRYRGSTVVKTNNLGSWSSFLNMGPNHKKPSLKNRIASSAAARAKVNNRPEPLVKMVPDKKDIREYCRQDARFLELEEFIASAPKRKSYVGISAANTERTAVRARILQELPFGPILGEE